MAVTASRLERWAGLSAMAAGLLFMVMQAIHPPDVLSSVTTGAWARVHYLGIAMSVFGLLGLAGLYARQVEEAGWLGLAGFLLFGLFFVFTMAFQFTEAFVSPLLATHAPSLAEGLLGIAGGTASEVDLGILPAVYALTGVAYVLGGLLFGVATFRAGVLPRWAAGLLVLAAASTLGAVLLPHPLDRLLAVPMGLALTWLGYALWSERREQGSGPVPRRRSSKLGQPRIG